MSRGVRLQELSAQESVLADALRWLIDVGIPLEGASDHGVSEALYLRDPDDIGLELYWNRTAELWPRSADGHLEMFTGRLDVKGLLAEAPTAAGEGRVRQP